MRYHYTPIRMTKIKTTDNTKEDMWMANKHIKRHSTLFVIREMQIKIPMRYHFTPTRMAIIRKTVTNVGKDVEKGMMGMWNGMATLENSLAVS